VGLYSVDGRATGEQEIGKDGEHNKYGIILGTKRCPRIMLSHCSSLFDIMHHDTNGRHSEHL
jgi:hypothetical protein